MLKTAGKRGELKKTITVISNDPEQKNLALEIKGVITLDVAVEPKDVTFDTLGKKQPAEKEISMTISEPGKAKVTAVSIDDPRFTVSQVSGDLGGESKWLVKFAGAEELGRIRASMKIDYTTTEPQTMSVAVRANVQGDLTYQKVVRFSKTPDGTFPPRTVKFKSRSGKEVKISKIEDPDGLVKIEIGKPVGDSVEVVLSLLDEKKDYSKVAPHTLKVHTNSADEPIAEINYSVWLRDKPSRAPISSEDARKRFEAMRNQKQ